jgi:hypothetical protein
MNSAQLPPLAIAPSQPLLSCSSGDCDNRGFALELLSCVATWPMRLRYDMANQENTARRRGWLLPSYATD